ncbi:MAG: tRNA pseudouridine synthase [Pseudomonadota bacterium]|jgi:tRNA pseudouridine38-40 synthase
MIRYKLIIEYFGPYFSGWQWQDNGVTVEQVIVEAIFAFTKKKTTLYAAGRTDAGVHARGQVAHFDLEEDIAPHRMIRGLNHFLLPHPVSIISCKIVDLEFHARFSAKKRHYEYLILNRSSPTVIDHERVWHVHTELDITLMQEAAKFLIGNHDFTSFRAKECQSKSPIKTLDKIEIKKDGDVIKFSLSAQSFLHHMVRNIVGTLKMVGEGKIFPSDIEKILNAKDRSAAGITAPAYGLYFMKVDY